MIHALLDWKMKHRAHQLAALVGPHLAPGSTILDVGAGTGHNAQALLERGACAQIRALDVVDMRVVGPPVEHFDGRTIPLNNASVDVVLLFYVLHYHPDPVALLRECARVARRGVLVVQSTYQGRMAHGALRLNELFWGPIAWRLARELGWIPDEPCSLAPHHFFSEARMQAIIRQAGLTLRGRTARPWRFPGVCSDLWRIEGDSVKTGAETSPGPSS